MTDYSSLPPLTRDKIGSGAINNVQELLTILVNELSLVDGIGFVRATELLNMRAHLVDPKLIDGQWSIDYVGRLPLLPKEGDSLEDRKITHIVKAWDQALKIINEEPHQLLAVANTNVAIRRFLAHKTVYPSRHRPRLYTKTSVNNLRAQILDWQL